MLTQCRLRNRQLRALSSRHQKTFQSFKETLIHGPNRIEAVIDRNTVLLRRCAPPPQERTFLSCGRSTAGLPCKRRGRCGQACRKDRDG